MTLSRRHLLQSCLGTAGLSLLQRNALAQSMDTARILAGFPAGSPIDAVCRAMAEKLRPGYARSLIVENRAGVGGHMGRVVVVERLGRRQQEQHRANGKGVKWRRLPACS